MGKKVNRYGSYFFNNSNNLNNQVTDQQSLNGTDFYKENSLSKNNNYNHRINLRLDYKIDSANSILITPSINLQKNDGNSIYSTEAGFGEIVKSSSNNTTNTEISGYNIGNNILFRHSFAKKGRTISVGVTTNFNRKSGNSYVVGDNKSFDTTGILMQDSIQNQFSDNFTNGKHNFYKPCLYGTNWEKRTIANKLQSHRLPKARPTRKLISSIIQSRSIHCLIQHCQISSLITMQHKTAVYLPQGR
jgi:hypothetical protein